MIRDIPTGRQRLPRLLAKLTLKHSALFFQKLILSAEEEDEQSNVKHYDHQCQGIQMLLGFLKTKEQNAKLKAFITIRGHILYKTQPVQTIKLQPNGTTRRTFLNTTFTGSEYSPFRDANIATIRSQNQDRVKSQMQASRVQNLDGDLEKLLLKVKLANSRSKNDKSYSFREPSSRIQMDQRENYSFYLPANKHFVQASNPRLTERIKTNPSFSGRAGCNYCGGHTLRENYGSGMLDNKSSKREFILQKFNRIEDGLCVLGSSKTGRSRIDSKIMQEIQNIKMRLRL